MWTSINASGEQRLLSEQSDTDKYATSSGGVLCSSDVPSGFASSQRFSKRVREQQEGFEENETSNISLGCEFCAEVLKTSSEFISHLRNHKLEALFTCPFCQRIFGSYPRFVEHLKNHFFDLASKNLAKLTSSQNENINSSHVGSGFQKTKTNCAGRELVEITNSGADSLTLHSCPSSNSGKLSQNCENSSSDCTSDETQIKPVRFYPWSKKKFNYSLESKQNFQCKQEGCLFNCVTLGNYDRHLGDFHFLASSFLCLFCPREFASLNYLQKHVRKMHGSFEVNENSKPQSVIDEDEKIEDLDDLEWQPDILGKLECIANGFCGRAVLLKSLCQTSSTWTQCLSFSSIACSALEEVMKSVQLALGQVEKDVPSVIESPVFQKLLCCTKNFSVSDTSNQYQLVSFLKKQPNFVEPVDIKFGEETEIRNVNGLSKFKQTIRTGQFIPITDVLSKIRFQHEDVFLVCLAYDNYLKKLSARGILFDINQCKGRLNLDKAKVIINFDTIVECEGEISVNVSLQLYFDELETANPIGSRATIHKIGCFYWCLKNLPPWLNSDLRFTFVVALVSYLDVKSYGFSPVVAAITNDLKKLENGITFATKSGKSLTVKANRLSFVADNLAYHSVFGFNENFSGGLCCEKCTVPQSKFKETFEEKVQELRSAASCLNDVGVTGSGVKSLCRLKTSFFEPYDNFTADLHHDIFQGGLMHTVKLVLNNLIFESGYLSLQDLNSWINWFNYGRDVDGKPSEFAEERLLLFQATRAKVFYPQFFAFRFLG